MGCHIHVKVGRKEVERSAGAHLLTRPAQSRMGGKATPVDWAIGRSGTL